MICYPVSLSNGVAGKEADSERKMTQPMELDSEVPIIFIVR